jgi:exodeoxyribonuclease VII small subunit
VNKSGRKPRGEITFESALKELESIANRLEDGSMSLDKSIEEFERGTKLARFCHQKLEEAERKIEILQKGESGEGVITRKVKVNKESGEIEDDNDLQGTLL